MERLFSFEASNFEFQTYSKANLPVNLEILSSSPLLVCEGGHVLVTSDNIAMVLDIAKYGVEENGVIFTLITPPTYGTLTLDLLTTRTEHSFTLRDIDRDKVNKFSTTTTTTTAQQQIFFKCPLDVIRSINYNLYPIFD